MNADELANVPAPSPEQDQLQQEIVRLQATKAQLQQQVDETQGGLRRLVQESLSDLQQRKQALQTSIEQLEQRQERLEAEMHKNFAGASQDISVRVQGFKDYLVNSLQELVTATEQLNLVPRSEPKSAKSESLTTEVVSPSSRAAGATGRSVPAASSGSIVGNKPGQPQFSQQEFEEESRQIRKLLEQYRSTPNYYGPPWQLRRTFEPIHAERVSEWFFDLGGRGAVRSLNSRLQNILVAAAAASVLYYLYGGRLRVMILADSPERLGDWRRGLQDCLGITRADFGPDRGVALFESPDALAFRADRLLRDDQLPLIMIDDSEETVNLSMLQFPLLLAFAPEPQSRRSNNSSDFYEF